MFIILGVDLRPLAGYSGTALAKKLGIKSGSRIHAVDPPADYRKLLGPMPDGVAVDSNLSAATDIVHVFSTKKGELARLLKSLRKNMRNDATLWISWPKKAARVPTDITEDVIRDVALPLGFVDVKVCAVDEVWSGLKLVVRKELRQR